MNESTSNSNGVFSDMILAVKLLRDPESPMMLKALPLLALLYFVAPEGLFFWPMGTPIDDMAVFYAALRGIVSMAPPHLIAKHTGDASMNYVDGEYETVETVEPISAEKPLSEEIIINPDRHNW